MIQPLNNKIQLQIDELKFGAIESETIAEKGIIINVGEGRNTQNGKLFSEIFQIGKTLYFKAWAVDIITDTDGKKYYFISADSDAICAIE